MKGHFENFTTTASDTTSTIDLGTFWVVRPLKVFPDHLCCLRWAKAYRDLVREVSGWGSLADDWDSPEDHEAWDDCNCGQHAFECTGRKSITHSVQPSWWRQILRRLHV